MALKLYDFPMSPNGRKVRAVAIELGIPLEIVNVDLMSGANVKPEFLRVNPNGKVPVLEDNGWYLFESSAIMQYLCGLKPQAGLYPTDPKLRAEVNQWLAWDGVHLAFEGVFPLYRERMFRPMANEAPRQEVEQIALENLNRFAGVLNSVIEGKQYLVGDRLTIADFGPVGTLMYSDAAKIDLARYPNLKAYLARIAGRESWKQTAPPPMS
jgi:glutathione S-transferase